MLVIKSEFKKWLGPIDVASKESVSEDIIIMGRAGHPKSLRSFSCLDVQRTIEGSISFVFNDENLYTLDRIDLLEFFYHFLDTIEHNLKTSEAVDFLFPNSDHKLGFSLNNLHPHMGSVKLSYAEDCEVFFDLVDINILKLYQSIWKTNLVTLNKLYDLQPELFQYQRFSTIHPGAKNFTNNKMLIQY